MQVIAGRQQSACSRRTALADPSTWHVTDVRQGCVRIAAMASFEEEGENWQRVNENDWRVVVEERRGDMHCDDNGLCDKSIARRRGGRRGRSCKRAVSLRLECVISRRVTDENRGRMG